MNPLTTAEQPPRRVISLVPSLTESLFDLGLGESVVGITDYCIHPREATNRLPRLGGPKNPRVAEIRALEPDLVLANREENTRQTVESLEAAGMQVWVTFPRTVGEAIQVLWELAGLYQSEAATHWLASLEATVDRARDEASGGPEQRYFCPIWFDQTQTGEPWFMTFNGETYCNDILSLTGGENVFATRERRYPLAADLGQEDPQDPGGRDTRYPRVSLAEIRNADPEIIFLPSEPYEFSEAHRVEFMDMLGETRAARNKQIYRVDGSLITWHGTRIARAIQEISPFFVQTIA